MAEADLATRAPENDDDGKTANPEGGPSASAGPNLSVRPLPTGMVSMLQVGMGLTACDRSIV